MFKSFTKRFISLTTASVILGVAVASAAPVSAASNGQWSTAGKNYAKCVSALRSKACTVKAGSPAVSVPIKGRATYQTAPMQAGLYKIDFKYDSSGTAANKNYDHDLGLLVNGKEQREFSPVYHADGRTRTFHHVAIETPIRTISIVSRDKLTKANQDVTVNIQSIQVKKIAGEDSREYWAQKIIEEQRSKSPRISVTDGALKNLREARENKCSSIEMIPGACVKLDKQLLKSLYQVSKKQKFRIGYFTDGGHVTCSDHYMGRAADLVEFDGSGPTNKKLLSYFVKTLPKNQGYQVIGPGDDANHSGANAHWHVALSGKNTRCSH